MRAPASNDASADWLRLLDLALARGGADLKDLRFELALRGLGRRDAAMAQRLAAVDVARLALFEAQFRCRCGRPKQAADLAALFYMAITGGIPAIARPTSSAQWARSVRDLIAQHLIVPHAAARPQPPTHGVPHELST